MKSMLSSSCEYGLRASLYLASLGREDYVSIGHISEELNISFHFLTKTFQKLTEAGLMESQRGPSGGVRLAQPAQDVTLKDIIVAIDGDELFTECVLGLPECGNARPCPFHDRWAAERKRLEAMFMTTTLEEMAEQIEAFDYRLKYTPVE